MTLLLRLCVFMVALVPGLGLAAPLPAASLPVLVQQALALDPQAIELRSRAPLQDAEAEAASRWLAEAPDLSISALDDGWTEQQGRQEWEVELGAPLWRPGQRAQRMQTAQWARRHWQAQQAALALQLAGQVREAVWQVQESRAQQALARQRLAHADALARDVFRRVAAGELARADRLLAQADRLAARSQLAEATQQVAEARAQLFQLTGQDEPPLPAEETPTTLADPATVPEDHPLLRLARAERDLARARTRTAATDASHPAAALIWKQDRDSNDTDFHQTVGLKISLPLGARHYNRPALQTARAERSAAEARLHSVRRDLSRTLANARSALHTAHRQRDRAARQERLAQENLTLAQRAFAAGEQDLAALLRMQGNALDARDHHQRSIIACQRASARLNQALGVMP